MQGYSYSIFSLAAIVIHLIINFELFLGRGEVSARSIRYRGFLLGVLAYYITDGAWGIFAGLGWTRILYADTILFFLSLVAFVFMWSGFVIAYLKLGKGTAKLLSCFGYMLFAVNMVGLALNPFNNCFFHVDAQGCYQTGWMRDPAFYCLVAYNLLIAFCVFLKFLHSRDEVRRRSMMVFLFCITMAAAMVLQIIWPLTPFTSLGCLVGNCFLHIFVIADEQAAKHMAELEKALERARAAEKARSMFFSIVSHDIRTPLNAILGYAELLQDGTESKEEREEALQAIRGSGTTLLQLVNDVLDLAKMDSGRIVLHPERVDLSLLTDEVLSTFRMMAASKGIQLVNQTSWMPPLLLDEHRFRQILFNLIGNAVKFTSKGSVTIGATYAVKVLEVTVSDTGCGIAPDMLAHILEPFVQVQDLSHSAARAGGTGLGLSICKRLVEVMGGELFVESELGKGSTFRVRIPGITVHEEERKNSPGPRKAAAEKVLPKHVLIVDDSPVNRKVLAALLKKAGVAGAAHAGNGEEALSELDSAYRAGAPYDFVFSDFWMPKMNGLEFIENLRADSRFRDLPVFAVTADTEFRRDPRTDLFSGILLKPLTYEKLVELFTASDGKNA